MDEQSRGLYAWSFGSAAEAYESGRPGYPEAALQWMLPAGIRAGHGRVLDLGAGTGRLTRPLVGRGLEVVAVEPLPEMRAQLTCAIPAATVLDGVAEDIPLADGSVDAVLVAQAWHWVDPSRAVPEVARVLRPGGTLGLIWNIRDDSVDWVAELGAIITETREHSFDSDVPEVGRPFGEMQHRVFRWRQPMTRWAIFDLVASRSYVILLPPKRRAAMFERVRTLLDTHPETAGRNELELPYLAAATRALLFLKEFCPSLRRVRPDCGCERPAPTKDQVSWQIR